MALTYTPHVTLASLDGAWLREQYLTGLTICGSDGQPLPDTYYDEHIRNAVGKIEEMTQVDIAPRVTTTERHDYRVLDYSSYGFLQLFRFQTLSVQAVRAVYPTGQTIQVFPLEWVRLDPHHSQIHLIPTAGSLGQVTLGQGADYLPMVFGSLGYLPHLWEVDYTSGFPADKIPRMVADAVMKLAAIEILTIMSDTIMPLGISSQSLGIDGLSQSRSFNVPAFKARIDRYTSDLGLPQGGQGYSGILKQIRNTYLGINLASV